MSAPVIASVVEGHGEIAALPTLIRRIALEMYETYVESPRPFRLSKGKMTGGAKELPAAVRLQAQRHEEAPGTVIVLLDSDDDDPEELRVGLQAVVEEAAPGAAITVVAVREFEAWFLAGAESLRGHRDVRDDASYAQDPEAKRDCKGAMQELMISSYAPIRHQAAFASLVDLNMVKDRSPSFCCLIDAVERAILRST